MVTEPGVAAIKTRIVLILKNNATLWNGAIPGDAGTMVKIEVGLPENAVFDGTTMPCCYVTNDQNLEKDQAYGPVSANAVGASLHEFRFRMMFFDQKEDGQASEASLDAFQKLIKEIMKGNVDLRNPSTGLDPLAIECFPILTQSYSLEYNGKPLDGRVIILRVRVGSN